VVLLLEIVIFKKLSFNKLVKTFASNLEIIVLVIVAFNLFLASWNFINGDLLLTAEVARDFLILEEIEQKKFILIGPRSGIGGVFHGPLWAYLNYPIYYLSNADPIAVGWFWILIVVLLLFAYFFIVKDLFSKTPAYFYVVLMSLFFATQTKYFIHEHGLIFIAPFLFWSLLKYTEKFNPKFLILSVLLTGLLIQFGISMATLIPITFTYVFLYLLLKRRSRLYHLGLFIFLLIPLSTFILFDLRHDFLQFNNIQIYLADRATAAVDLPKFIANRVDFLANAAFLFSTSKHVGNSFILILFSALLAFSYKSTKFRRHYILFIFLVVSHYGSTLLNKGGLLLYHTFIFTPLAFMILASLTVGKYKTTALFLVVALIITNQIGVIETLVRDNSQADKIEDSWKNLKAITQVAFEGKEPEFGYFVYSPDKLAYEAKFAMIYQTKRFKDKKAIYFEKRPVTYIISAPPPLWDPYVSQRYWREQQMSINVEPIFRKEFPNGYFVERFELSGKELLKPFSEEEDSGLWFR